MKYFKIENGEAVQSDEETHLSAQPVDYSHVKEAIEAGESLYESTLEPESDARLLAQCTCSPSNNAQCQERLNKFCYDSAVAECVRQLASECKR
ncbi:MAG: hypothetical protein HKN85_04980 [Gammaproteobacteria bacterium]|nr:hypothetical protein [Gammaproteobacteria bacterium]